MDIHYLITLVTEAAVEHAEEGTGGVLGTLGINWKLFLAQLVNFSIILFILWRWVFKPVAGALEARRQKIEESVAKAEKIETQMREADSEREQKLQQARLDAEEIIKRTASEAEKDKQQMTAEKQQMLKEVREEVADLVVMATEKILREKLTDKKDREMIQNVMQEMK